MFKARIVPSFALISRGKRCSIAEILRRCATSRSPNRRKQVSFGNTPMHTHARTRARGRAKNLLTQLLDPFASQSSPERGCLRGYFRVSALGMLFKHLLLLPLLLLLPGPSDDIAEVMACATGAHNASLTRARRCLLERRIRAAVRVESSWAAGRRLKQVVG